MDRKASSGCILFCGTGPCSELLPLFKIKKEPLNKSFHCSAVSDKYCCFSYNYSLLPPVAASHRPITHMVVVMVRAAMIHRMMMVRIPHVPAAKTAERIDPGTAIAIIRACEQPSDEGQYNNK